MKRPRPIVKQIRAAEARELRRVRAFIRGVQESHRRRHGNDDVVVKVLDAVCGELSWKRHRGET